MEVQQDTIGDSRIDAGILFEQASEISHSNYVAKNE